MKQEIRRKLIKILRKLDNILFKNNLKIKTPPPKKTGARIISENGNIVMAEALGIIWKLDKQRYLDREILEYGVFDPYTTAVVNQLVKPGMVVIDVGANFGYYTLQFAKLTGRTGCVYAVEPVDRYRERLIDTLKLNNVTNVKVIGNALSNKQGKSRISVGECSATFHWQEQYSPEESYEVPVTTLDALVKENKINKLDFIKIDMDGHETTFLEGAEKRLTVFKPLMIIEFCQSGLYTAGSASWELADKLESTGYAMVSVKSKKVYPNRRECLRETANFSHSVDVLCIPLENPILKEFS